MDELTAEAVCRFGEPVALSASLSGRRPPFARNSDTLLSTLRAFEVIYARYDEHQREMERYWCLRWLLQESVSKITAVVLREATVRLDGLPMIVRVPSLPDLPVGARVAVQVAEIDLLDKTLVCTFLEALADPPVVEAIADAQEAG